MLQQSIQRHAYKASFLAHVIIVHSVIGPINGPMWVKGLRYVGVLWVCVSDYCWLNPQSVVTGIAI